MHGPGAMDVKNIFEWSCQHVYCDCNFVAVAARAMVMSLAAWITTAEPFALIAFFVQAAKPNSVSKDVWEKPIFSGVIGPNAKSKGQNLNLFSKHFTALQSLKE